MRIAICLGTFLFPCLLAIGCSNAEKPPEPGQIEKEFNELQKNRQKEDPFAGKRK